MIFSNPFCKLGGEPSEDWVCYAIWISHPLCLGVISAGNKALKRIHHCFVGSSFEEVDINALLSMIVWLRWIVAPPSPRFGSSCLLSQHIACHIAYYIGCYITNYTHKNSLVVLVSRQDSLEGRIPDSKLTGYAIISICHQGLEVCTIVLIVSIGIFQVSLQVAQILKVSSTYMPSKNRKKNVLVVGASSHLLDELNMAALRTLGNIAQS